MKRKSKSINHAKRQQKLDRIFNNRIQSLGRYRKKNALDCGRCKCYICSRERSIQITKSNLDLEEQLHEHLHNSM